MAKDDDKNTERDGTGDGPSPDPSAASAASSESSATGGEASQAAKPSAGSAGGGKKAGKAPARGRRGGRTLFWLVLLLVLIAAGYYGWRHYGEELSARLGLDLPSVVSVDSETTETDGTGEAGESSEVGAATEEPSPRVDPRQETGSRTAGAAATGDSSGAPDRGADRAEDRAAEREQKQDKALAELEEQLADVKRRLNHQQTRLEEMASTTRRDWLLAEAEYLLRLARQRVLTEGRADNALSLMTSVDSILEDLDDPDLYQVRRALAQEINALRMAQDLDREGVFLELEALIDSADQLRVSRPETAEKPESAPVGESEQPWYRQLLDNARQALVALSGIVRVEKLEEPQPPLPTPSETERLRQGVRLSLQQAQLGLMREHQAIFDASLERARELVASRFADTETGSVMVERLQALAETQVTPSLPPPEKSLRALRDYMQVRNDRRGDTRGGSES